MANPGIALRWPCLAVLALACTHERTSVPPASPAPPTVELASLPLPTRPEPAAIARDHAVLIDQLAIPSPWSWRFEPGGGSVAALLAGECGLWAVASGDFLGVTPDGPASPCSVWPAIERFTFSRSSDPREVRTIEHAESKLVLTRDRAVLSGQALRLRAGKGREVRAAAFGPDDRELALLVGAERGPVEVEIWNLGTRQRVHELALTPDTSDDARVTGFALRWGPDALIAALECEPLPKPDPYEYEWEFESDRPRPKPLTWIEVQSWPTLDAEPDVASFPLPERPGRHNWSEGLFVDPEQRWLIADIRQVVSRDRDLNRIEARPIADAGPIGLEWASEDGGYFEPEPDATADPPTRRWTDTVGSSFVDTIGYAYNHPAYPPDIDVRWNMLSLVAKPLPDRAIELSFARGSVLAGYVSSFGWQLILAGRERLLVDLDVCYSGSEPCQEWRVAPPGCRIIDADWSFERLLLDCEDRWILAAVPDDPNEVDPWTFEELAPGTAAPRSIVWGPSGLAIWTAAEGLRVFEGARLTATHAAAELVRARLDEELDLGLVRVAEGLRVFDLASQTLGPTLAWTAAIEHVAFAPDRQRFAVAGGGELAVFEHDQAWPIVRWQAESIAGLGFRQDGAVLYVGVERPVPELALDPVSGELVVSAQLDRVALERIAAAELDPSWRWAVEEDRTILRTIDGQAIDFPSYRAQQEGGYSGPRPDFPLQPQQARTESGWFTGDVEDHAEIRVRLGDAPLAPVHGLDVFAEQLRRPNLVEEFFAGDPLPRPRLKLP